LELQTLVTGKTQMLALLGNPIAHTLSPFIHNTISKALGKELIYIPLKVPPTQLEFFLEAFKRMDVLGFNVTVPYKQEIMKFTDENSEESLVMGAVNTVKIVEGKLYGYNTDGEGFLKAFQEEMQEGFENKRVVILGAGGTARSIAFKLGTQKIKNLSILNRTFSKGESLSRLINSRFSNLSMAYTLDHGEIFELLKESDVIINTTDVGLYPDTDAMPISNLEFISSKHLVYDVIYNPKPTKFLKEAQKRGASIANGLGMLIHQGVLSYKIWTGDPVTKELTKKLHEKMWEIL
jgi:shikimate dehydrogenase